MKRKLISEAVKKGKGRVLLKGWVYRRRLSKETAFILLRDASSVIQCVIKKSEVDTETWETANDVNIESSVEVVGKLKPDPRAPGGFELETEQLRFIHKGEPFPIAKDFSPEFLLDVRHLWLRSRKMNAILKIRSTVIGAIHEFFRSKGYYEFTPPIFTPTACEGGATLFEVNYFGNKIWLTQSWQLYAEAAIFSLEKIYDVAPTFRSEKSSTSRHLAEFWMAEMEAAFMDYKECSEVAKEEVKFILKRVLERNLEELKLLKRDLKRLEPSLKKKFPTITYTKALKLLKEKCNLNVKWGKDLRTIEEKKLMELFDTPVVVTHYPKEIMAFYKPVDTEDKEAPGPVAKCFDMIAPEGYGEIVGGSERETDIEELKKWLKRGGEKLENYEWYFDLRRYGSVQHSGYGLGVERLIAWICGLENIKDAIPFPRTVDRWRP
ncbi:asparagine--tRNA ligase [Candidatus Woesearchaeota archaeon]|nr:asparagine--tRNA ligase [Candidatus Woesearchaeota archaeon]RLE43579.1 MAG: asparagine--tRNA ligase [Candidatus Woesearchaeota archaeon]